MVVQKTIDNLKERPHEEKKAVAGGIAIAVVIILMIGWGFLFLRNVQRGTATTFESAVPSDQLNTGRAAGQLNQIYDSSLEELRALRDTAAQNELNAGGGVYQGQSVTPQYSDQFGN